VQGFRAGDLKSHRRRWGAVHRALFSYWSDDNVALRCRISGAARGSDPRLVNEAALVESTPRAPASSSQLVGGMVKRWRLPGQMAWNPKVMFLDQPTRRSDPNAVPAHPPRRETARGAAPHVLM